MNVNDLVSIIGGITGIGGAATGLTFWFAARVRKEYASKRDWEHLKRNYNTMSEAYKNGFDDLRQDNNDLRMEMVEMKAILISSIGRLPDIFDKKED